MVAPDLWLARAVTGLQGRLSRHSGRQCRVLRAIPGKRAALVPLQPGAGAVCQPRDRPAAGRPQHGSGSAGRPACSGMAGKLEFTMGLLLKATEIAGSRGFRGVEANIGEVIAWRNTMWGLSDAMAKSAEPWAGGCVLPATEPAMAYRILAP